MRDGARRDSTNNTSAFGNAVVEETEQLLRSLVIVGVVVIALIAGLAALWLR
jgi:hypothetical protein